MHEIPSIVTERVDDIPLLLAQMERMGLAALLDAHFPTHGNWQGLHFGRVATIWLSSILSRGDHRLGQVQADEIRVKKPGSIVWMALAMMVTTRLWLGGAGSAQRDMPLIRRLIERVRRSAARRPLLIGTDGVVSYIRAIRETCRDPVHTGRGGRSRLRAWPNVLIAQVVKRYERRRVVETERRIGDGTPARVETLLRRSHGDGGINTAYLERLNATFRKRLAPLAPLPGTCTPHSDAARRDVRGGDRL